MLKRGQKAQIGLIGAATLLAISSAWLLQSCSSNVTSENRPREYSIVEVYDIALNQWSTLSGSPMPTPRSVSAAGVINNKLYVVGGSDQLYKKSAYDSLEIFDPATGDWTIGEPMPQKRDGPGSTVWEGKLYVVGGAISKNYYGNLYIYDPLSDSWSEGATMPTPRFCPAVGAIDGKIYVAGGVTSGVVDVATFEIYDIAGDFWLTTYDMPTSRGQAAFGVIGDTLYVAGGFVETYQSTNTLETYSPTSNWNQGLSVMNSARGEGFGVVYENKLYVVGGIVQPSQDSKSIVNTLSVYDPTLNTWTQLANMPTARSETAAGIINGKIYVVGGYASRTK